MVEAFGWGALGASALLVGALIAYQLAPSRAVIAVVMAFGTGLLIGPVSLPFTGGRIIKVEVSIGDDVPLNIERELAPAMARD